MRRRSSEKSGGGTKLVERLAQDLLRAQKRVCPVSCPVPALNHPSSSPPGSAVASPRPVAASPAEAVRSLADAVGCQPPSSPSCRRSPMGAGGSGMSGHGSRSRLASPGGHCYQLICESQGQPGEPGLLAVKRSTGTSQYSLIVRYDLRPVKDLIMIGSSLYLAALDVEKLRRKGTGLGLDVMQVSESRIAWRCLCSRAAQLIPLNEMKGMGEVQMSLEPGLVHDLAEVGVLIRVVGVQHTQGFLADSWHAVGMAVMVRCKEHGGAAQSETASFSESQRWAQISRELQPTEEPDRQRPEYWGIRVQQVMSLFDEIKDDMTKYCKHHARLSFSDEGEGAMVHICRSCPCLYRPFKGEKIDDHRGVRSMHLADVQDSQSLAPVQPNMRLVVERYLKPMTKAADTSFALLQNGASPLKVTACVSHAWDGLFQEFVETLRMALHRDDVIFSSGFSLNPHVSGEGDACGAEDLVCSPFAKALTCANKLVVVADTEAYFARRLWCAYETCHALEMGAPTFVWPHVSADIPRLQDAIAGLDVGKGMASDQATRIKLQAVIASLTGDAEKANDRLRLFLQERITCFTAALQDVPESSGFDLARIRQVIAEQERRCAIRMLRRDQILQLARADNEIEAAKSAAKTQQHAHAVEVANLHHQFEAVEENLAEVQERLQDDHEEELAQQDLLWQQLVELRAQTAGLEESVRKAQQHCAAQRQDAEALECQAEHNREEHKRQLHREENLTRVAEEGLITAKEDRVLALEELAELKVNLDQITSLGSKEDFEKSLHALRSQAEEDRAADLRHDAEMRRAHEATRVRHKYFKHQGRSATLAAARIRTDDECEEDKHDDDDDGSESTEMTRVRFTSQIKVKENRQSTVPDIKTEQSKEQSELRGRSSNRSEDREASYSPTRGMMSMAANMFNRSNSPTGTLKKPGLNKGRTANFAGSTWRAAFGGGKKEESEDGDGGERSRSASPESSLSPAGVLGKLGGAARRVTQKVLGQEVADEDDTQSLPQEDGDDDAAFDPAKSATPMGEAKQTNRGMKSLWRR